VAAIDRDQPDIARELRLAVFRLSRRLRAERVAETVSDAEMAVLAYVSENAPATPGSLATRERVSAPAIIRVVNSLEAAGLVERIADAADGRRVLVTPTEQGRALVAETGQRRSAWLEGQLTSATPQEREALRVAAVLMLSLAER
jgi:DNA-binding MarR family transcriptional regulator